MNVAICILKHSDTDIYFSDAIHRYRYLYGALSPFEDHFVVHFHVRFCQSVFFFSLFFTPRVVCVLTIIIIKIIIT